MTGSWSTGSESMPKLPWKVLVTVPSLLALAIAALAFDQVVLAAAAGGALAGYLGKLNGS